MEVMAGMDPADSITMYSEGKTEMNYQQYLQEDGLENSRIGVLRELIDDTTDPEILGLFEKALDDMRESGAEIIDPVVVPGFAELRQDQWCAVFREDIEFFLAENVNSDSVRTIQDIIRIGTDSEFAKARLMTNAEATGRWGEDDAPCGNAYEDERRVAFRSAIRSVMDSLKLDAIVYPSWKNRPAHIDKFEEEYQGDNNQVISPHTGQPAFTVPMGYISGNLPVGLQFLGRMYDEGTLVKLSYAYEQATFHRRPPQ
jgi:Asp-tRNA(Asn)/Glu-tRNA(Gln) amidotransferase A subunit family amidase